MQKLVEMIACAKCGQETAADGKYCSHCGRVSRLSPPKKGEMLEVDPEADFGPLLRAISDVEIMDPDSAKKLVLSHFAKVFPRRLQVMIRLYGLDRHGQRSFAEIMEQMGLAQKTVASYRNETLDALRVSVVMETARRNPGRS